MPGLIAWNQANARFKESGVARELEDHGYLWSIAEGPSGQYKACVFSFKSQGSLDLESLQDATNIKLELAQ